MTETPPGPSPALPPHQEDGAEPSPSWIPVVALLIFCLLVRSVTAWRTVVAPPDTVHFIGLARNMDPAHPFAVRSQQHPLYPWLIRVIAARQDEARTPPLPTPPAMDRPGHPRYFPAVETRQRYELIGTLISVVAGTLLALPVYFIVLLGWGARPALWSLFCFALLPVAGKYHTQVLSDGLFAFLFLSPVALAMWSHQRNWLLIPASLLPPLAYFTRPEGLLLIALLPLLIWKLDRPWPLRLLISILFLLPMAAGIYCYAAAISEGEGEFVLTRKKSLSQLASPAFTRQQISQACSTGPGGVTPRSDGALPTVRIVFTKVLWPFTKKMVSSWPSCLWLGVAALFLFPAPRAFSRWARYYLGFLALLYLGVLFQIFLLYLPQPYQQLSSRHTLLLHLLLLGWAGHGLDSALRWLRRRLVSPGAYLAAKVAFLLLAFGLLLLPFWRAEGYDKVELRRLAEILLSRHGAGIRILAPLQPRLAYYAEGNDVDYPWPEFEKLTRLSAPGEIAEAARNLLAYGRERQARFLILARKDLPVTLFAALERQYGLVPVHFSGLSRNRRESYQVYDLLTPSRPGQGDS